MLYYLLYSFHEHFSFLNLFRYITFRASMAALTAFLISIIIGPFIIAKLKQWKIGENIRKDDSKQLDEMHSAKQDTPTMGGLIILLSLFSAVFLWSDIFNRQILVVSIVTLWMGVTGLLDDYIKLSRKKGKGLTPGVKLASQILLSFVIFYLLFTDPSYSTRLDVPFFKNLSFELEAFFLLIVVLVIAGFSNAVNLTDGLDGLAIGNVVMVSLALSILSYVTGNIKFSEYLLIPYIKGAGELTVFCSAMVGAGLGFLWFNCYPASVFMGDVGSLALGGAIGTVAILIKKELLLVLVGGVFVIEAVSVILQVASFRLTKRRIFKIAPIHHHFEFMGWKENKIIVRFWIIASLLALFMLVTLKVR